MRVILYKNQSEPERMDKNLVLVKETNCDLLEGCSMVDPILILQSNAPILANYAYIPDFGRYYFIKDNINEQGKIWSLKMHCDVLSSFKNGIRNSLATIDRNEFDFNLYIPDEKFVLESDTFTITNAIGGSFLNDLVVLTMTNVSEYTESTESNE